MERRSFKQELLFIGVKTSGKHNLFIDSFTASLLTKFHDFRHASFTTLTRNRAYTARDVILILTMAGYRRVLLQVKFFRFLTYV